MTSIAQRASVSRQRQHSGDPRSAPYARASDRPGRDRRALGTGVHRGRRPCGLSFSTPSFRVSVSFRGSSSRLSSITGDAVGPQVFNSFYILIFALAICIPLGLGGAIYLEEYARQGWLTTVLRFATETLAGIPSLILGLFGFLVVRRSDRARILAIRVWRAP